MMEFGEIVNIVGIVIQVAVVGPVIWLARVLIQLHLDVRMLIGRVDTIATQLATLLGLEKRVDRLEYDVKNLHDRINQ